MKNKDYNTSIEVACSPDFVFNHIKDVTRWWSEDFEGNSAKLNDEFVISHPGAHYSKQKLTEFIPNEKIVWLVTDSKPNWLEKDEHEWTNTKMIFELSCKDDKTVLHFTHKGLVPEKECYGRCKQGWDMVIKERLFKYVTEGRYD